MLSYTFDTLNNKSYNNCATEEYDSMNDLFASILIKGIKTQLKRGLIREYNQTDDVTHNIRGKIDIAGSVRANYTVTQKYACSYDELTINSKPNQILKATLKMLVKKGVALPIKRQIRDILMLFTTVKDVSPKSINWNVTHNNKHYRLLLTICNLTILGLENGSDADINNFFDEESMQVLFKQFTIGYYRRHYKLYRMHSPKIRWDIQGESDPLPALETDVFLSNQDKSLLILTKYNVDKVEQSDITLLYSMIKNIDVQSTGNISGAILLATTQTSVPVNTSHTIGNVNISVYTLPLNSNFKDFTKSIPTIT